MNEHIIETLNLYATANQSTCIIDFVYSSCKWGAKICLLLCHRGKLAVLVTNRYVMTTMT